VEAFCICERTERTDAPRGPPKRGALLNAPESFNGDLIPIADYVLAEYAPAGDGVPPTTAADSVLPAINELPVKR